MLRDIFYMRKNFPILPAVNLDKNRQRNVFLKKTKKYRKI